MKHYKVGDELMTAHDLADRDQAIGTPLGIILELVVIHSYSTWCRHGDVGIDCGAATGWHTFGLAAAVGPTGHVYAFEALPEQVDFLVKRAHSWGHSGYVL